MVAMMLFELKDIAFSQCQPLPAILLTWNSKTELPSSLKFKQPTSTAQVNTLSRTIMMQLKYREFLTRLKMFKESKLPLEQK
jgi:hypothetical protein